MRWSHGCSRQTGSSTCRSAWALIPTTAWCSRRCARCRLVRARWSEQFYEDVPYAQVPAVRADRLHYLGLSAARAALGTSALRAVRETRAFWFAHAPAWQRPILSLLVGAHWAVSRALFRLFGRRDALADERALSELAIDSVIDDKVAAMRAYATQTAYFFPAGDAIYGALVRSRGHYVERYWKLPEPTARTQVKAQPDLPLEQELARVDRLLAELRLRERPRSTSASPWCNRVAWVRGALRGAAGSEHRAEPYFLYVSTERRKRWRIATCTRAPGGPVTKRAPGTRWLGSAPA